MSVQKQKNIHYLLNLDKQIYIKANNADQSPGEHRNCSVFEPPMAPFRFAFGPVRNGYYVFAEFGKHVNAEPPNRVFGLANHTNPNRTSPPLVTK